jgi:Flp pilus assembly protein TadD/ADP-heptose:LPS heptosyltransferase
MLKFIRSILGRFKRSTLSADEKFYLALQTYDRNFLDSAYQQLEEILKDNPEHSDSLNLLGICLARKGKLEEAKTSIERAIAINPKTPGYFNNLANIYRLQGNLQSAEDALRNQVKYTPERGSAYIALADFLRASDRPEEATATLEQAKAATQEKDAVTLAFANDLVSREEYNEALKQLEELAETSPENTQALLVAAKIQTHMVRPIQAEFLYKTILQREPDNVEALHGLGFTLQMIARGEEAEACYRLAFGIAPNNAPLAKSLVSLCIETRKKEAAEDLINAFLSQYPEDVDFLVAAGRLAALDNDFELAGEFFSQAERISPKESAPREFRANLHGRKGEHAKTQEIYQELIAEHPKRMLFRYNYSFSLLTSGQFRPGLENYEKRIDLAYEYGIPYDIRFIFFPMLESLKGLGAWDGSSEKLANKHLLVHREQGLGDCLMCLRFLPQLKKLGAASVTLLINKELVKIAECVNGIDRIIPSNQWDSESQTLKKEFDLYCSIMSLPYLLETELEDLPSTVPYITPQPEAVTPWQSKLKALSGTRIGIAWGGNPGLASDKARSIPLEKWTPLLSISGIDWISLQKGEPQAQLEQLPKDIKVHDFMDECLDFHDTAALISCLDLVISVDTSVVHLAGALNTPVWMFNRTGSEWRWMHERDDSPWYPAMRLFNQAYMEPWDAVVARMAYELEKTLQIS